MNEESKKWDIFWERYEKMYPVANLLRDLFDKELSEAWKAVSTRAGEREKTVTEVTEKGEIIASQLEWLKMGIFCEFIIRRIPEIYGKQLKVVGEIEKILPKLKEIARRWEEFQEFQEKGR